MAAQLAPKLATTAVRAILVSLVVVGIGAAIVGYVVSRPDDQHTAQAPVPTITPVPPPPAPPVAPAPPPVIAEPPIVEPPRPHVHVALPKPPPAAPESPAPVAP